MKARTLPVAPALLALLLSSATLLAAPPAAKPKAPAPAKRTSAAPAPAADSTPAAAATATATAAGTTATTGATVAAAPAYNTAGVAIVAGFFGLLVLGGGAAAVVARSRSSKPKREGRGDGRPPEPILPKRQFDWELRMTEEQERAMLRGVEAYRDAGHSLLFYHEDALIWFYRPHLLVSLVRLTDDFLRAGPPGVADPVSTVGAILRGYVAAESPGVLHHTKEWYGRPIGGLDFNGCASVFFEVLTKPHPYVPGTNGASSNENTGMMTVKIKVEERQNVFCVSFAALLAEVHKGQAATPAARVADLARQPLIAIARGAIPGGMWSRGNPSPAELALVERIVTTSVPAPQVAA